MMALNPMLRLLADNAAAEYNPVESGWRKVRHDIRRHQSLLSAKRERLFDRSSLPPISALVKVNQEDREALIAQFRAKELRNIADARHQSNRHEADLARKRLRRINSIAQVFSKASGSAV